MAEKRRLTRKKIAEVIKQVVEGLEYLHGQNLSHGNLKPSNVLVKTLNPVSIVLTDAGSTSDERWVHEPHYLPPESARGIFVAEYAQAADIWALGVIALHLALGGMPTMEDPVSYPEHTIHKRAHDLWPPKIEPEDDDPIGRAVRPMLALDPRDRPNVAECQKKINNILRKMPPTVADTAVDLAKYHEKYHHAEHDNNRDDKSDGNHDMINIGHDSGNDTTSQGNRGQNSEETAQLGVSQTKTKRQLAARDSPGAKKRRRELSSKTQEHDIKLQAEQAESELRRALAEGRERGREPMAATELKRQMRGGRPRRGG